MKNNKFQIITIVALIVSVLGVTIGFAAFSQTLRISSSAKSKLNYENANEFKVAFTTAHSSQNDGEDSGFKVIKEASFDYGSDTEIESPSSGEILPECSSENRYQGTNEDCGEEYGVRATNANVSETTITGVSATFSGPNKTVRYEIPVANFGFLDAYLKGVEFKGNKTCTAQANSQLDSDKLNAICNSINITYDVLGNEYTETNNEIYDNVLKSGEGKYTYLYISSGSSTPLTTEKITISFPDIELHFSSTDS